MKNIIIIAFYLIAVKAIAQETYLMWSDVETQRFGKEVLFKSDNKFLNGSYKLAENSGAYTEVTFKNGKMVGTKKDFDFSGNIEQEMNFNQEGKADGKSISYFQNGKISDDLNYKNGLKEGEWKTYTKKGELRKTEIYKNDLKEGKWVSKLLDGVMGTKLVETIYYKNDNPTGTWTQKTEEGRLIWKKIYSDSKDYTKNDYHTNGKLAVTESFKDNKLHGICKYYDVSGIILSEKKYETSYLKNEIKFYPNGNKKEIADSKDGYRDGLYQEYSETGQLTLEGQYKIGYKSGEWKQYNEDDMLEETYTYADGRKNGIAKTYNEAATVESKGMYANDEKTGLWKHYKLNGKIAKEIEYKNDKIISEKKYQ